MIHKPTPFVFLKEMSFWKKMSFQKVNKNLIWGSFVTWEQEIKRHEMERDLKSWTLHLIYLLQSLLLQNISILLPQGSLGERKQSEMLACPNGLCQSEKYLFTQT